MIIISNQYEAADLEAPFFRVINILTVRLRTAFVRDFFFFFRVTEWSCLFCTFRLTSILRTAFSSTNQIRLKEIYDERNVYVRKSSLFLSVSVNTDVTNHVVFTDKIGTFWTYLSLFLSVNTYTWSNHEWRVTNKIHVR